MSLSIFSAKPGGIGHLESSVNCAIQTGGVQRHLPAYRKGMAWLTLFCPLLFQFIIPKAYSDTQSPSVSQFAADECRRKLKDVMDYAAATDDEKATRFTEEEINSYIKLYGASEYRSCLKNLNIRIKNNALDGVASIDFDCLNETSSKSLPKLIPLLFSGVHEIFTHGTFVSGLGEGRFQLSEARFDDGMIPIFLAEQTITALCMRQKPPFDPMKSSKLPHGIKKVTLHSGYIMVYQ